LQAVMQLISIPTNGFMHSVAPVMSYNFGANKPDRVKAVFKRLLMIGFAAPATIALSAMCFPTVFAKVFTDSGELIELVGRVLPIFISGIRKSCSLFPRPIPEKCWACSTAMKRM
jgi:Na+-driven multidrug efflux pump